MFIIDSAFDYDWDSVFNALTGQNDMRIFLKNIAAVLAVSAVWAVLVMSAALAASAGAKTLRWSNQGDIATHDAHAQNEAFNNQFNGQIYEQLLSRDKNMKLIPTLATSVRQTAPTTWLITLRKGVKWHDGSAFTADDVVFSILRSQAPTSNYRVYSIALGKPRSG